MKRGFGARIAAYEQRKELDGNRPHPASHDRFRERRNFFPPEFWSSRSQEWPCHNGGNAFEIAREAQSAPRCRVGGRALGTEIPAPALLPCRFRFRMSMGGNASPFSRLPCSSRRLTVSSASIIAIAVLQACTACWGSSSGALKKAVNSLASCGRRCRFVEHGLDHRRHGRARNPRQGFGFARKGLHKVREATDAGRRENSSPASRPPIETVRSDTPAILFVRRRQMPLSERLRFACSRAAPNRCITRLPLVFDLDITASANRCSS